MLWEYDFKVVHRLVLVNMDVDGLNKYPCPNQKESTRIMWHIGFYVKEAYLALALLNISM